MSRAVSVPASRARVDLGDGAGLVERECSSWQVSRSLSGGGLPGQARAVSGSSVGSGSVTIETDEPIPWPGPAPGGDVEVDVTHDVETLVDGGAAGWREVARMRNRTRSWGSWMNGQRVLDIEDRVPRGSVSVPVDVGAATLDAAAVIDAAARASGYHTTRPPRAGAYASWSLVGSLWSQVRGVRSMTSTISDGARYATVEGRAMLADSMVVGRLFDDSEAETVQQGYAVEFDLYVTDWQSDTFLLVVHGPDADLLSVELDNISTTLTLTTTTDTTGFTVDGWPTQRVRLYRAPGEWRLFIDGHYQGAVEDYVTSGAASVEVAVAGGAHVGGLQVYGPQRPEVDAVSTVESWTGSTTHTHTPTVEAPRGVLVLTTRADLSAAPHHAVTYGGVEVPLVRMASSEAITAYAHYLADPPPGPQEVALSDGSGTLDTTVVTVRGDGAVQVRDDAGLAAATANPSVVLGTEDTTLPLSVMYRASVSGATGPASATTLATLGTTHRVQVGDIEASAGGYGWHYTATSAATRLVGVALMYQLGDEQLGGWWEPTALVAHAASPLDSIAEPTTGRAWDVIQQVSAATLGATWIDERGRLVYRNRDMLRAGPVVATIDALDTMEDVAGSVSIDELADRVELTYRPPVVSVSLSPPIDIWSSTEPLRVNAGRTVTLTRDLEGAASQVDQIWRRTEDASTGSRYSAWTAPPGSSGSAPPDGALVFDAEMVTASRLRVTVRNTTSSPLWVYSMTAAAYTRVEQGAPITIASGASPDEAESTHTINCGSWVQDTDTAHSILAWVAGEMSSPQATLPQVRIVPDTDLMLGDTVLVRIDSMTGDPADTVTLKALVSGMDLSHAPGELSQSVSLTLLAPTEADLAAYFSNTSVFTEADVAARWASLGLLTEADVADWMSRGGLYTP